MNEGVNRRAEIDNKGHYALQWVAGGGAALLVQFYFQAQDHAPDLSGPIAIAVAMNLLALVMSLFLHFLRRTTSLRFESGSPFKWCWSRFSWAVWFAVIAIVAMSYILLSVAFICTAFSSSQAT